MKRNAPDAIWHDLVTIISERWHVVLELWPVKAFLAFLGLMFGDITSAHVALAIVMILDLIVGMMAAAKEGRLDSRVARSKSVGKLLSYMAVLIVAHQVEVTLISTPYRLLGGHILSAAIIYLTATEALSVIENVEKLSGIRVARSLRGVRRLLRKLGGSHVTNDKT